MAHRQPQDYTFESEVQADILAEFGSGKPMRIFRNNVGDAYPISTVKAFIGGIWSAIRKKPFALLNITQALSKLGRPVRYSVVGSADILGILCGDSVTGVNHGRALAIEVKKLGNKLDPDQVTWRDMFIKFGGVYILATCIDDVYAGLRAHRVNV